MTNYVDMSGMLRGLPIKSGQVEQLMRSLCQIAVEEHWQLWELRKLLKDIAIDTSLKKTKNKVQTSRDLGIGRGYVKEITES